MQNLRGWLYLGAVAALLMGGCGGNDSNDAVVTGVSADSFPFGLNSSDATFDLDNDGVNDQSAGTGFTYDAAGRVVGFRMEMQFDYDDNGIMDRAETFSLKLNPDLAFDPENFVFDSPSIDVAIADHSSSSIPAVQKGPKGGYIPEELLMIAALAKAAPVEIKAERYSLTGGFFALSIPESMVLEERTTLTFSYNAQGQVVELSQLLEASEFSLKYLVSVTYDSQGNPTKIVSTGDFYNDGWPEDKRILNYANTYNAAGNLTQVVMTDPAATTVEQTDRTYDEAGRKLSENRSLDYDGDGTWDQAEGISWIYDEAGRLATREESSGLPLAVVWTTSYDYDTAGRLTSYRESDPGAIYTRSTLFSYNEKGQFVSHTQENTGWRETYTFAYDEEGSLAGYTFGEDWNNDGIDDRQEVAVATIDGSRIAFAADMLNAGSGEPVLTGKRSFDLAFLAGLPTAAVEWPVEESVEVGASVPALPAYVMIMDLLYQGIGPK